MLIILLAVHISYHWSIRKCSLHKKNKEMVSLRKRNCKYVFFTEEIYNPFAQSLNRPFSEQNKVLCKTGLIFQR